MTSSDPIRKRICVFHKLILLFSVVCIFGASVCSAEQYSTSDGYAVLLEQSPVGAGYVTPEVGIHDDQGGVMDLRAVPKPGYRFMYWLGDVENSTENETTISVDSPKIVVAVFSRTTQVTVGDTVTPGAAIGGLRPSYIPSENGYGTPVTYPDPEDPHDDPVPEPSTIALLAIGSAVTFRKRK